jgi:hypothetical protein
MTLRGLILGLCLLAAAAVALLPQTLARSARETIGYGKSAAWAAGDPDSYAFAPASNRVWNLPAAVRLSGGGGEPLTAPQAAEVGLTLWANRESAAARLDVPMLRRIDTGALLEADVAAARADRAAGLQGTRPARGMRVEDVVVPRLEGFPAWFLVRGHVGRGATSADPTTVDGPDEILVVERAGAGAQWRLALEVSFDGDLLPAGVIKAHGDGVDRLPAGDGLASLRSLARYFRLWHARGLPPLDTRFVAGPVTGGRGAWLTHRGATTRARWTVAEPTASETFPFALDDDVNLSCGAIHERAAYAPGSPGGALVQAQDRSTWGRAYAPGRYRSIRSDSVRQVCVVERFRSPLVVYGGLPAWTGGTADPVGG